MHKEERCPGGRQLPSIWPRGRAGGSKDRDASSQHKSITSPHRSGHNKESEGELLEGASAANVTLHRQSYALQHDTSEYNCMLLEASEALTSSTIKNWFQHAV